MFAPEFDYYRAGSVAEVGELLAQYPEAKLLAGGHSLIPVLKLRLAAPPALIDISRLPELKGISAGDGTLRIGALTTHAELAASAELGEHAPALAEAAGKIGDPAVRNRGTIRRQHRPMPIRLRTCLLSLSPSAQPSTQLAPVEKRSIAAGDFLSGPLHHRAWRGRAPDECGTARTGEPVRGRHTPSSPTRPHATP